MAYQSLYRKYRPQTFADVMGQGHVVRTLQNALASGRIAHGYLFTGTRGTAKTTVARLLAKALNCESATHPVAEPCNRCDACKSITAGTCIDVIEMDAASHRGVADIEEVRKAVGYGPMQFRYKVFIIDEAHQLSSDAKDAFLKTLEEPPANVVFVLATTEPQAIPITIRSRCQQFDFKRGSLSEITSRLQYVLDCEGVTYEPAAINLVARGAEGSYRDSLSLLEQVLAFTPTHISANAVETVLGSLDAEMLSRVIHAVAERNAPETFALAGQILDAGKEARTLLRTLSLHFRDLMLVSVGGPAVSAELTQDEVQLLQIEARLFSPHQMMRAMEILNEAQGETRWNNQHRLLTELTFLKLMNLGGEKDDHKAFITAPIIFAATSPVAAPVPVPVPAKPILIVEAPVTPPVVVALTPKPETVASIPEAIAPPVMQVVQPVPSPTPEPKDELSAAFFEEASTEEEDGIEYEPDTEEEEVEDSFAPITDDDAPDDALPLVATAAVIAPLVIEPVVEAPPAEQWELFPEVPQEGPGLFEELEPVAPPVPVAAVVEADPPPIPPPPVVNEVGTVESEPLFPTPREGTTQPPALSLENAEESPLPTTTTAAVPSASISEPALEDEPPLVTLHEVRQAWPTFMRQADRLSRKTALFLREAEPVQIAGRVIVITMHNRTYYEMLTEKPEAQGFIRKLLARILGREGIGVRLELDPTQAAPPKRSRSGESPKKKRYDRFAAIDAIDMGPGTSGTNAPAAAYPVPSGNSGGSFGWSSGGSVREAASPAPTPSPSSFGNFGTASTARPRDEENVSPPAYSSPAPTRADSNPAPAASSTDQKRAIALAEPLVQEVLMVFGGDIVIE